MKKFLKVMMTFILILCSVLMVLTGCKDKKPSNSPETSQSSPENAIEWLFMSYSNEDIDTYCETQPMQVKDAMEDEDFKEYVKALVQRGNEFYGDSVTIDIKEEKTEVPKQRRNDIADEVNMVYSDIFDEFDLEYKNISIKEAYEIVVDIKAERSENDRIGIKILTLKTNDGEWIVWQNNYMEIAGLPCEYDYYDYEREYDFD